MLPACCDHIKLVWTDANFALRQWTIFVVFLFCLAVTQSNVTIHLKSHLQWTPQTSQTHPDTLTETAAYHSIYYFITGLHKTFYSYMNLSDLAIYEQITCGGSLNMVRYLT